VIGVLSDPVVERNIRARLRLVGVASPTVPIDGTSPSIVSVSPKYIAVC
jgi:hypothetical protein